MKESPKVAAVVVAYCPEDVFLVRLLEKLNEQCVLVIVVDNTPFAGRRSYPSCRMECQLIVIDNGKNLGIGAAQNIGIKAALEHDVTHVAIFDQDSVPDDRMIERLLVAEEFLRGKGVRVAAVGPRLVDDTTGDVGAFIAFEGIRKKRLRPPAGSAPVPCFSLLASGTLFHRDVLSVVGLMNSDLFIEYVDVEWGARALSRGYTCYGVPSATLFHNLGDSRVRLSGGLVIPFHRPIRHYYTMRNAIFMQRQSYVPFYWKVNDVFRTLAGFLIYGFFNPPRIKQIFMMSLGILHGLRGRSGSYAAAASTLPKPIKQIFRWASS